LPDDVAADVAHEIAAIASAMRVHLDDARRGERLRDGIRIVLTGAPNVGKSSLFNLLAKREAAIVSPEAGTTRDVIEAAFDLAGYPVLLMDTAGIHDASALSIEQEGIRRARARLAEADLRVRVLDATDGDLASSLELREAGDPDTILVLNKIDLAPDAVKRLPGHVPAIALSATDGTGIAALEDALVDAIATRFAVTAEPALTRARHRAAIEDCLAAFSRMGEAIGPELAAEDLRLAVRALGRITGRVDVEDLLDIIFRDFCIGK
jgi:tRNA modification GTPase